MASLITVIQRTLKSSPTNSHLEHIRSYYPSYIKHGLICNVCPSDSHNKLPITTFYVLQMKYIVPGESVKLLSCKGSGFTFGSYGMHWIRQPTGKPLEWMGIIWYDASKTVYAKSVEGRTKITGDNPNSMVYLKLSCLTAADSAVYYCTREVQ
uniref:Ig-like domain-containing protein n=1 Tax=Scleropages formosus TaxID=113540 RepID=A0A8C9WCA8_SCLFO